MRALDLFAQLAGAIIVVSLASALLFMWKPLANISDRTQGFVTGYAMALAMLATIIR